MKHVVNFSGGLCSFWAAYRVVQKYGPNDVTLLFADTKCEDSDLYEFNRQVTALLGCQLVVVADGRDPWQLFAEQGLIGNNRFPICSVGVVADAEEQQSRQINYVCSKFP